MVCPLKILHLEDDPLDAELVRSTLAEEGTACEIVRVETRDSFIAAIAQGQFDIIFVDYFLPGFSGLAALDIVKERCPNIPLIFISGKMGEELAIEVLKAGATDYVLKDRISRLVPSVRRALSEAEEWSERKKVVEELKESREQLRNLAAHLQSVREKERMSIVHEIYDELGQVLTAVKMDLRWLTNKYGDHEGIQGRMMPTMDLVDRTIRSVKRICTELRPAILDHFGLGEAVAWHAEEFQKRTGIECAVTICPDGLSLDRDLSTALFRIFQEALTNVLRHARATKVEVMLIDRDASVTLRITDNGIGMAEKQPSKADSFGLLGIRECVLIWNGEAEITGDQNSGTTIMIVIPKE
ncbi:MAG: response regulator [Thermodesulfovibrionales bacterium]